MWNFRKHPLSFLRVCKIKVWMLFLKSRPSSKQAKSLNSLTEIDPLEWHTTKLVQSRILDKDDENTCMHQGAVLHNFSQSVLQQCGKETLEDLRRLDVHPATVVRCDTVKIFLDTPGWYQHSSASDNDKEADDHTLSEVKIAVEYIVSHFREPLKHQVLI